MTPILALILAAAACAICWILGANYNARRLRREWCEMCVAHHQTGLFASGEIDVCEMLAELHRAIKGWENRPGANPKVVDYLPGQIEARFDRLQRELDRVKEDINARNSPAHPPTPSPAH